MPARRIRSLPPSTYKLHSAAAAAPAANATVAAPVAPAAAAVPGMLLSGCAEGVTTSRQERMASQVAAAQALAPLHSCSSRSREALLSWCRSA
jgi:hypothetical protein